ncbi:MAG: peptide-methionine (R)-S-oxide reductase, partial [Pararhizobium sp.]|nr:peptide-methionine (R)-S-oxide reductase [Pararhizobium sp.]
MIGSMVNRRALLKTSVAFVAFATLAKFGSTGAFAQMTATDTTIDFKKLSAADWQKRLSPEQFYVLRKEGTERAGT